MIDLSIYVDLKQAETKVINIKTTPTYILRYCALCGFTTGKFW